MKNIKDFVEKYKINEKLENFRTLIKGKEIIFGIMIVLLLSIIGAMIFVISKPSIDEHYTKLKNEEILKEIALKNEKIRKEIEYYDDLMKKTDGDKNQIITGCLDFLKKVKKEDVKDKNHLNIAKINSTIDYCDNITKITTTFSTGAFFDPKNEFKTVLNIDFSQNFYDDIGEENSKEYIENRSKAKKELLSLLEINPKVGLKEENITFYPKKAILNINLTELTKYNIGIKEKVFPNGIKLLSNSFDFETQDSKYLKVFIKNPVSLYRDTHPPRFEIVEYKSKIDKVNIKLCRIDNESYAKIEQLREQINHPETKDFFAKKIDELKTLECFKKEVLLKDVQKNGSIVQEFNFDDIIGNPARSGLYYMTFDDTNLRYFNDSLQYARFFGIIDSHLTMKISKNGQGFFFVNDFEGKPLANQKIRAYKNEFKLFESKRNEKENKYEKKYENVLKKEVLSKPIELGITDKNGILKVDLDKHFKNVFDLTFEDRYQENSQGLYPSLFITSTSNDYLTYNNSRWNAGIAPFNFGYKINDYWWGEDGNNSQKEVSLNSWENYPKYLSHTFTDRVLYLPGEEVNLKSILRKTHPNLIAEKNKEFTIIINDPKRKEIFKETLKTNDFGSIYTKYNIPINASLGSYYVYVMDGDMQVGNTSFSVEIFQNPKFKNTISLETSGLAGDYINIKTQNKINDRQTDYLGDFSIKGNIISTYYNGSPLKNALVSYKVYKQYYYEWSRWDDCYYGCYYEPEKEFYTEGETKTNEFGQANFEVKIEHKTNYEDYKYIVEATVIDEVGDKISGANSITVKLPKEYKRRNANSTVVLETTEKFYKLNNTIDLKAKIDGKDKWDQNFNDKYVLIIKKKDYTTEYINDIKGYNRPINKVEETIKDILFLNSNTDDLTIKYTPKEVGEYIFEYAMLKKDENKQKIQEIINSKDFKKFDNDLLGKIAYNSILIYGDENAKNPIVDDNKVQILSNKVSYKLGEKAKFLIRLPFSSGKVLWTIEKSGVIKSEYIDVKSNLLFKEVIIDDNFVPNAYVSVLAFDTNKEKTPEYKVGYTEIVVDKTDKKSVVEIVSNKKEYKPREEVTLDINVKDKNGKGVLSEVSIMVVDDSIISLMGNIDLNLIDKFFKKLPFQIQTSLTNIVMLQNFYFSRPGLVGGSGFGNFKGGDSAVSSRNIFKNTAYYNPSIITNASGKARVKFNLPDNITNFRIIAISNSKNNIFGAGESFINVRKNVVIEPKTPMIVRDNDLVEISAQIFNTTSKDVGIKVDMDSDDLSIKNATQKVTIKANKSSIVNFEIQNKNNINKKLNYMISALGDSVDNSDKFEGIIELKEDPILVSYTNKTETLNKDNTNSTISIALPENTDIDKSTLELKVSNNRISGVEKIVSSLAVYPYGYIEQTTSSTMPNVVLKNFDTIFSGVADEKEIDKNINYGIERILSMQQDDGGFGYWPGDTKSDLSITPYVLRTFIEIQKLGETKVIDSIKKAKNYLENNKTKAEDDVIGGQITWALASAKSDKIDINEVIKKLKDNSLNLIARISYTYGLVLIDSKKYKKEIDSSIELIKKLDFNENSSYRYRDDIGNKAIFTSMLLDYDYDVKYIDTIIDELYKLNWTSYYYSTQTKNNSFMAFYKYLSKYGANDYGKLDYTLNGKQNSISVGEELSAIYKKEFVSKDFLVGNNFEIPLKFVKGKNLYIDVVLKQYPKDKKLVKPYSNKITIKREIFEVGEDKKETLITNNIFKKGGLYRVVLTTKRDDNNEARNLVIEDYQPAGFKAINERLKVNSNTQNNQNDRYFDYKETRPEVIFLNSSYNYGDLTYSYLFRAEYAGTFTFPPVSAYMMYDPEIRAYSEYNVIQIK